MQGTRSDGLHSRSLLSEETDKLSGDWIKVLLSWFDIICFIYRALLDAGADPNLGDEYVNIYHTAREKGVHSLDVMVSSMS